MASKKNAQPQIMDLVLKADDKDSSDDDAVASQNLVQKAIGLLGVPGFILNLFGPQILIQAKKYPRLFSFLAPLVLLFSGGAAFTYLLWPLFNKIVGDWLPYAKLKSDDALYDYLRRWVHYRKQPFRQLELEAESARYKRQNSHDQIWWPKDHVGARDIVYEKGGKRYFWYNRTLFILESVPSTGRRHYYDNSQDIKLKALSFSHAPIKNVLNEAWATYQQEEASRNTRLWHFQDDCWEHLAFRRTRPLDTVDLDENQKASLLKDLATYLSDDTRLWYNRRGIPYRRGYLFHGPPGTGKTSLSVAIAGHFNMDMYILSLANPKLNDSMLATLVTQIDTPAVLLLEDIDSAGLTREISSTVTDKPIVPAADDDDVVADKLGRLTERVEKCNVTLSGVLNALDGAASPEGHVLIMSTNSPETMDPALARAGRIDCKVAFRNATYETAKNIFKRMINETDNSSTEAKAHEFASKIPDGELALADLQGYLLNHIGDTDNALRGLDEWVKNTMEEKAEAERKRQEAEAKKESKRLK